MAKTFFISDTHFDSERAFNRKLQHKKCPFENIEQMNETLIKNWNDKVGTDDIIYHLGDFSHQDISTARAEYFLKQLNGKKYLIRGNIENQTNTAVEKLPYWEAVYDALWTVIGDYTFMLCHYPIAIFPPDIEKPVIHLHGHLHGDFNPDNNSYDVGVDLNNFAPLSYDEILDILKNIKKS
jgi:calcineurin-like phosphoesterase family protein